MEPLPTPPKDKKEEATPSLPSATLPHKKKSKKKLDAESLALEEQKKQLLATKLAKWADEVDAGNLHAKKIVKQLMLSMNPPEIVPADQTRALMGLVEMFGYLKHCGYTGKALCKFYKQTTLSNLLNAKNVEVFCNAVAHNTRAKLSLEEIQHSWGLITANIKLCREHLDKIKPVPNSTVYHSILQTCNQQVNLVFRNRCVHSVNCKQWTQRCYIIFLLLLGEYRLTKDVLEWFEWKDDLEYFKKNKKLEGEEEKLKTLIGELCAGNGLDFEHWLMFDLIAKYDIVYENQVKSSQEEIDRAGTVLMELAKKEVDMHKVMKALHDVIAEGEKKIEKETAVKTVRPEKDENNQGGQIFIEDEIDQNGEINPNSPFDPSNWGVDNSGKEIRPGGYERGAQQTIIRNIKAQRAKEEQEEEEEEDYARQEPHVSEYEIRSDVLSGGLPRDDHGNELPNELRATLNESLRVTKEEEEAYEQKIEQEWKDHYDQTEQEKKLVVLSGGPDRDKHGRLLPTELILSRGAYAKVYGISQEDIDVKLQAVKDLEKNEEEDATTSK